MKRLFATLIGSAALLVAAQSPVFAQAEKYIEDVHYSWLPVDAKVDTTSDKAGEVVEFFSYGCPHCKVFYPHIEEWKATMPVNVNFIESPVSFGRESWGIMSMGKHIADKLDMADVMHPVFFDAVHDQRLPFNSFDDLQALFATQGVDGETFLKAAESLQVQAAFKKSEQNARNYAVQSVPSVMVNGHWMVNSQNLSSFEEVFDVVEFLLVKDGVDISERVVVEVEAGATEAATETTTVTQ